MALLKDYTTTFANALGAKRYIMVSLTSTVASAGGGFLIWNFGIARGAIAFLLTVLVGLLFITGYLGVHFLLYANKLRRSLSAINDLEAYLDRLSQYLEEGNGGILNKTIKNAEMVASWVKESREWQEKVELFLEQKCGLRERNNFKHIVVLKYYFSGPPSDEYIREKNILAWKLLAIKEIVLRYSEQVAQSRISTGK